MTTISVIMSAHNECDYIGAAIRSIQQQDMSDWELIIIDDGSTDNTYNTIKHLPEKDPRIKLMRNIHNLGLAASLNKALANARGQFIARMDGDDVSLPTRFSHQLSFLQEHPDIDVLGAGMIEIDSRGHPIRETYCPEKHEEIISHIYKECPFIHPTVIARREFFDTLGGYNKTLRRAQDYDLWLRGYKQFRYHNLQMPLIYYRRSASDYRSSAYSSYVLWRAVKRDKRLLSHGWYALRPLLAALLMTVQRKTFQTRE
ncbi:MAG: glycosyltransferase [bacterium]